jgi:predicted ABC-type ATPase
MKPEVIVFAGPNGSGKSTITRMAKTVGRYINADAIKQSTRTLTLRLKRFSQRKGISTCCAAPRMRVISCAVSMS